MVPVMTSHWIRDHARVNKTPLLTCQLQQGLNAHAKHLISRCQG